MSDYDISIGFILVNNKGNFLVMKKAIDGVWDFPKGHVKPEDTDELTTAIRELKEETGIDADKLNPIEGFRNENTYINPNTPSILSLMNVSSSLDKITAISFLLLINFSDLKIPSFISDTASSNSFS